jgi:hypothetical protein
MVQGWAARNTLLITSGMDPSAAEAINRGMRGELDISEASLRQFQLYWRGGFYSWEDAFYQHADGLFVEPAFRALKVHIRDVVQNTGIRAQWRLQRRGFAPEFVSWMDKLVAETPIDEAVDSLGLWRSALAAEGSGAPY